MEAPNIDALTDRLEKAKRLNKNMDMILEQTMPGIINIKNLAIAIHAFKDFAVPLNDAYIELKVASVELDLYYLFNHLMDKVNPPELMKHALKEIIGD